MKLRRRTFIAGLGAAVAWPLAARAQSPAMPLVGVLDPGVPEPRKLTAFLKGLGEAGFVEGRTERTWDRPLQVIWQRHPRGRHVVADRLHHRFPFKLLDLDGTVPRRLGIPPGRS
jgi:hypothetical protein